MKHSNIWLFAVAAIVSLSGCYSTTIRSGRPVDPRPAAIPDGFEVGEFDDRWHHGFVNGIAEVNGNYNLQKICPNGWAEIKTRTSFLNVLAHVGTGFAYSPQSVTLKCAAAVPTPAAPPTLVPPPVPVPAPTGTVDRPQEGI